MNILYKFTFKNIAKYSAMMFTFGIFPFLTLLLFYNPIESLLGLLLSYIGLVSTACIIYLLFIIKNKAFKIGEFISSKINSITDKKLSLYAKYAVIGVGMVLSILTVYYALKIGSFVLGIISFMSALNPLMIIALNIYYVGISLSCLEYLKGN